MKKLIKPALLIIANITPDSNSIDFFESPKIKGLDKNNFEPPKGAASAHLQNAGTKSAGKIFGQV